MESCYLKKYKKEIGILGLLLPAITGLQILAPEILSRFIDETQNDVRTAVDSIDGNGFAGTGNRFGRSSRSLGQGEGLSFSYEDGNEILHNISLSIAPGEYVGIVGKAGCGKTTLVKTLSGPVACRMEGCLGER